MSAFDLVTFSLAFVAYVLLGVDAAARVEGRGRRALSAAVALFASGHALLLWHGRYEYDLALALTHGTAVFAIFHVVWLLVLLGPFLATELSAKVVPACFGLASIVVLPLAFNNPAAMPLRFVVLLAFVVGLLRIGAARARASRVDGQPKLRIGAGRSCAFELGQPWRDQVEASFRSTHVVVRYSRGALEVEAELEDDEVYSDATADNQRTWELGDAFEVFVRRADEVAYSEVHVTPNGHKLHLRFEDFDQHRRIASIDEVAADPSLIEATVETLADGWRARLRIPFPCPQGSALALSFCRYDASRGREPVLSTSSPHPVIAFHRPTEWTLVTVVG